MKLNRMNRLFAAVLLFCCLMVTTVYADVTQEDIDNAKEQIESLQNQKDDVQDAVDNYTDQKENLEGDLNTFNNQMNTIVAAMNDLEDQITDKQAEITAAQQELEDAIAQSEQQYEDMKLRIQFMYENSSSSMLEMLISAESISDFLNRTEYITDINNYDRDKLEEFQQLQADIEAKKETLESEEAELLALQEEKQQEQDALDQLIATTQANLNQTTTNLANAQTSLEDIEAEIQRMEEYEQELELQKAREDAERMAAIKDMESENTSGTVYIPGESDLYLLGAIIQCESEGEPYEGKLAVGSVVMNRVKNSHFPNTISEVIYQKGQFSPVTSGRYAYRLQAGVNQECLRAAQEVLDGTITVSCLYFRRNNGVIQGTVIGNHVFY